MCQDKSSFEFVAGEPKAVVSPITAVGYQCKAGKFHILFEFNAKNGQVGDHHTPIVQQAGLNATDRYVAINYDKSTGFSYEGGIPDWFLPYQKATERKIKEIKDKVLPAYNQGVEFAKAERNAAVEAASARLAKATALAANAIAKADAKLQSDLQVLVDGMTEIGAL